MLGGTYAAAAVAAAAATTSEAVSQEQAAITLNVLCEVTESRRIGRTKYRVLAVWKRQVEVVMDCRSNHKFRRVMSSFQSLHGFQPHQDACQSYAGEMKPLYRSEVFP